MKPVHFLALLLLSCPTVCLSQTEMEDSISFGRDTHAAIQSERIGKADSVSDATRRHNYHWAYNRATNLLIPYTSAHPLDLHMPRFNFSPGRAELFYWNSGKILAAGGTRDLPGLMRIDSGELGISQSVGNFTFYAGGTVNKYGYFNGLHTQYGLAGRISYQFTPKLSATVFGDYYFGHMPRMANNMPMPPSMIGYYGRTSFGGYFDIQINERWGVQTGAQAVRQAGTNRYEAEPIVTPYYKISKKVSIGLPVGQILYHVLKR